jgi:carbamoyltransferase
MPVVHLGIARARMGPAAALIDASSGAVRACEENRLSRGRQAPTSGPPELAIAALLAAGRHRTDDIASTGIIRDPDMGDWATFGVPIDVDAHQAHADYARRVASADDALCVVCDSTTAEGWTAWRGRRGEPLKRIDADLGRFPLTQVYGELTQALGLTVMRDEHLVESLARSGRAAQDAVAGEITCDAEGVSVPPGFRAAIDAAVREGHDPQRARRDIAASVQQRLGHCLVELLQRLSAHVDGQPRPPTLFLSGGLFFNTHFTTVAAASGIFAETHVAAHPGRNGAAVGAALTAAASASPCLASPYLGPGYDAAAVKEALDNCKLSYDLLRPEKLYDVTLHALGRGRLVGWYHGAMEWGPRALGHRSVLADPLSAHVLDNLNGFLKQRPSYRGYGVSVPLSRLADFFEGPPASPYMQYEYRPRDRERFRPILPPGVETLRVHTVDDSEPRFLRLLELWGEKTGTPVLVNTSFNGFHEPLVCSPRDAIRVFYGTGLDMLVLEDFVLRK